jgi:outer membrane protein, multidrug efflux system
MLTRQRWIAPAIAACALMGCSTSPPVPIKTGDIPKAFIASAPEAAGRQISKDWWKSFASEELTGFVEAAHTGSLDIESATARVEQARAQAGISVAALLPAIGVSADARRQGSLPQGASRSITSSSIGLAGAASYELDFRGLHRNEWRAARHSAQAALFARDAVNLMTEADVANVYFAVLAIRQRIAIAKMNIEAAKRVLAVTQAKVSNGVLSNLELAQQTAQVLGEQAQIPKLGEQEREMRYALAILLGRFPEGFEVQSTSLEGIDAPVVEPGTPLSLLSRRPDVAEAEARLLAAHANLDAARAVFLPSIGLSTNGGWTGAALSNLINPNNLAWNVGASLLQTVFDGGRLSSQHDLAKGQEVELVADYRKVVLNALADTESGLGSATAYAEQERLAGEQAAKATEAFRISELQYREGVVDLLTVLQVQQMLFTSQDALVQIKLARLQASVGLYRALGGGWTVLADKSNPTRNDFQPLPF